MFEGRDAGSHHAFWRALIVWSGALLCVAGFALHRTWAALPVERLEESLLLAVAASGLAGILYAWRRLPWPDAVTLVWLSALVLFAGPLPVLAVIVLALAALALGTLFTSGSTAIPLGLALIAAIGGWLLPLPVHHRAVYAMAFVVLILWRRRQLQAIAVEAWRRWRESTASAPLAAVCALLLVGLVSTACWLPTMQFDDLAYHLGLPSQLQTQARYALAPTYQVWTLAPWAGNVLHAAAQLLAGGEARGAMNALWIALTGFGLYRLTDAIGGVAWQRWASVALFASLPLSMMLAGNMQTEAPAAAVTVALAGLVLRGTGDARRSLMVGAVLAGFLLALKAMHAVMMLPLLFWAVWRHRAVVPWRWMPVALAIVLSVGGSSYAYAWFVAGNPVLPLFNATFRSPYFPSRDFEDPRWQGGLDANVIWELSFDTSQYMEAWDGAFGFVLVALVGAWLIALTQPRTRAIAWTASAGMLIALLPMQYARYLHPPLVLLLPALVVALPATMRGAGWLVAGVCVLNAAFATNSSWVFRAGALGDTVRAWGQDAPVLEHYAPERLLAVHIRERTVDDGAILVIGNNPGALAELGTRGRTTLWYSPSLNSRARTAESDPSGLAWARLLQEADVAEVLLRPDDLTSAQRAGLELAGARREHTIGTAEWWRLPKGERQ